VSSIDMMGHTRAPNCLADDSGQNPRLEAMLSGLNRDQSSIPGLASKKA